MAIVHTASIVLLGQQAQLLLVVIKLVMAVQAVLLETVMLVHQVIILMVLSVSNVVCAALLTLPWVNRVKHKPELQNCHVLLVCIVVTAKSEACVKLASTVRKVQSRVVLLNVVKATTVLKAVLPQVKSQTLSTQSRSLRRLLNELVC